MVHTPKCDDETCSNLNPDFVPIGNKNMISLKWSDIKFKNPSKTSKFVNNQQSWASKETEWIFNDKRLLFAVEDGETRRKWIKILKHMIKRNS